MSSRNFDLMILKTTMNGRDNTVKRRLRCFLTVSRLVNHNPTKWFIAVNQGISHAK